MQIHRNTTDSNRGAKSLRDQTMQMHRLHKPIYLEAGQEQAEGFILQSLRVSRNDSPLEIGTFHAGRFQVWQNQDHHIIVVTTYYDATEITLEKGMTRWVKSIIEVFSPIKMIAA